MDSIKKLHAHLIRSGLHTDPSSIFKVVSSYALSPAHLHKSFLAFSLIQNPTTPIWNSIIRGLAQTRRPKEAILVYTRMRRRGLCLPNHLTFLFLLKACTLSAAMGDGRKVHLQILKLGFRSYTIVSNALIHLYGVCGELDCARKLFDELWVRDSVSWNSLICGYSQKRRFREVLDLFQAMQSENVKADEVTMVKVLLACMHLGDWESADLMVQYIDDNHLKIDVYLGNTLIDLHGRQGRVELARKVFDAMCDRNIVSWNAMVMGHSKAGDLVSAQKLFDAMPERDLISWTSIIVGYAQASYFAEALNLFQEMMMAKVKPDAITLASVLSACAHLGATDVGKAIHDFIHKNSIKMDVYLGNALIDMYCKCGCIEKALEVFVEMKEKDVVSWTSIITGMAVNGYAEDALKFFSQMLSEGVRPSSVTFIGVLLACSHSGLVDRGFEYFKSMTEVYKIEPEMKHYGCMVDLLGRSGLLDKAYDFILKLPVAPDPMMWRILLSACLLHDNVDLAEIVTKKVLELDPSNSGNYVLLSKTYASAKRWYDATKVREVMEVRDVQKEPGCSSIEVSDIENELINADGNP